MRKSALIFFLLFLILPFYALADIEIRFLDVGDADAALIQCDGHAMLIDGGNKSDSSLMYSVLKEQNITHLDIVVASHVHQDHIGGIPGALNFATADLILCPVTISTETAFKDFEKYANEKGNGITVPNVGDTYSLGEAEIFILAVNSAPGINNSSIILKITYGKTSFLFTGDAEADAELEAVSSYGRKMSADVLKVAHHGSDTSSTYKFLQNVSPTFAVISVGTEIKYEFPSETVLQRLKDMGAVIYRTDKHEDIIFTSNGKSISVTVDSTRYEDADVEQEALIDGLKEAGVTYIVNTKSKKFHDIECRFAQTIKEKNRLDYTGTREDLINRGYEPCKSCNP